jgi:hypothetical protein
MLVLMVKDVTVTPLSAVTPKGDPGTLSVIAL